MILYSHQQKIIDADPKKTGLFLGTGSGKTRTALTLARGTILIVAPKTQVQDHNWEREYEKIKGSQHHPYYFPIIVFSKETFRRDWDKLPHFDTIIVDEAHTVLGATPNIRWKNKKPIPKTSQLFEALESYLKKHNPERIYLCTATIMKSPMTVWAAAKVLGHSWDFYKFRQAFYIHLNIPNREIWVPKKDSETKDKLADLVKRIGYVGRLEDFFDVPDQTRKTIYVELTKAQRDKIKDIPLEYPDAIVQVGKKHMLENGVISGNEFNGLQTFDNAKIDTILDLAIEFPKMVIFARYKAQIDMIFEALVAEGYTVGKLTGDTKDRGEVINSVNKAKECILIVQSQLSAGFELPDIPVMVFASLDWSWVSYEQAQGRIQRANNIKKNLYIHLVVKGGIDEHVYKTIMNKQDFNDRLYTQTSGRI